MSNQDNTFGRVLIVGALLVLVLLMLAPSHKQQIADPSEHASIERHTDDIGTTLYLWHLQRNLMSTQRGSAYYSGMRSSFRR